MSFWRSPSRTPLIIAHRGSSAIAPENTLAAFQQAVNDGADAVELDVRFTRDREVVVFHDSSLDRTTDGEGRVRDSDLERLRTLSAGAWFHRRFAEERIPTLAEVFELLAGQTRINIEIKCDRRDRDDAEIADRCVELIRNYDDEQNVLVSSFIVGMLKRVKTLSPSIATGLLYHPVRHIGRSPLSLATRLGTDYLILSGARIRKVLVRNAQREDMRVAEYTVNSLRRRRRALRFGLDAVFTDHPRPAREFFSSPGDAGSA